MSKRTKKVEYSESPTAPGDAGVITSPAGHSNILRSE